MLRKNIITEIFLMLAIVSFISGVDAQSRQLVWSDEFNASVIDPAIWSFDIGLSNDNIQYYTDRTDNARLVDDKLQIIALEESYMGFNYTSARLHTQYAQNWRYGRIEARIKLPGTPGFVPAFWLMPEDDRYGWWPVSGEIDIMEYPTTEGKTIYGTVHTETYNSFSGSQPHQGNTIHIADAETEFHIYAVEWTEETIDFYVDDQKYFTFTTDFGGSDTWPFNQPFFIILNLAIGGGWVGNPTAETVFPAVMEVDYVRVYQYMQDMTIQGSDYPLYNSQSVTYSLPDIAGADYSWYVPGNAQIVSGQNTSQIEVDWNIFGGNIKGEIIDNQNLYNFEDTVHVSYNYLKNSGFEKGVKYWKKAASDLADTDIRLTTADVQSGKYALYANIKKISTNPWDIQISQRGFDMIAGQDYVCSFWAKAASNKGHITMAIINSDNFSVYASKDFSISDSWSKYDLQFTSGNNTRVNFNIDMGAQTDIYHFDDFIFSTPELYQLNQIKNVDFTTGSDSWNITTLGQAAATGSVENGEYVVSIDNGGVNPWDVHLGQENMLIEQGKEYTVIFDAYGSSVRDIKLIVGKNSEPWTVYCGDQTFTLTTSKQTYTFSFTMNEPSDASTRFGFDIGVSPVDVNFDNIMLSSGTEPNNINTEKVVIPGSFKLNPNYPNPFNPSTTIQFTLPKSEFVELKVYNILGKEVSTLISYKLNPGNHHYTFEGKNLASGAYYYQLVAGDYREVKKMILLR